MTTQHQPKLTTERADRIVILKFQCVDIYAAMKLYDQVCEGARSCPILRIDVEIAKG